MVDRNGRGETFGLYLIGLKDASGSLADLVTAAKTDPKFPRRSSPDDVRKHLNAMQVDGDMHAVVDDAKTDWLSR